MWTIPEQDGGANPANRFRDSGGASKSHHGIDDSWGKQQIIAYLKSRVTLLLTKKRQIKYLPVVNTK